MDLFKLFAFNMTLIFVGFFACSGIDKVFGRGTVNKLWIVGVIVTAVIVLYTASKGKE